MIIQYDNGVDKIINLQKRCELRKENAEQKSKYTKFLRHDFVNWPTQCDGFHEITNFIGRTKFRNIEIRLQFYKYFVNDELYDTNVSNKNQSK